MIINIFKINADGLYENSYLKNQEDNTYFNGETWEKINFPHVTVLPPHCKSCRWDNERWVILEELEPLTKPLTPSSQDKINANLAKENLAIKLELQKQQSLNAQILKSIAEIKGVK